MFVCIFRILDWAVDLEDIQKKRRKQIPNFTATDGFMNSMGMLLTFVDLCSGHSRQGLGCALLFISVVNQLPVGNCLV